MEFHDRLGTLKRLRRFFAATLAAWASISLALLLTLPFVHRAYATIGFVKNVGTAASEISGTVLVVTVPAEGVAAGNSILLTFAMDGAVGPVSAADSQSNLYTVDAEVSNLGRVRTVILSAHNVTPLASGDVLTVTHPLVTARALSANEFSGLAAAGALDRTSTAIGSGSTPSSGLTPTTTQADELLLGAIGVEAHLGLSFTPGADYLGLARAGTRGGPPNTNITINPEYRIVNALGAYAADGLLGSPRQWAAAIATYKMALGSPTPTATPTQAPTETPTGAPTPTATHTQTPTPPATETHTATPTQTPTNTRTPIATRTQTLTPSATETHTATPTSWTTTTPLPKQTLTPTASDTPTATLTSTPTATSTPAGTPFETPTPEVWQIIVPGIARDYSVTLTWPWEVEDNDYYVQANGPPGPGQGHRGYPDDVDDWFLTYRPSAGPVDISLTGHTGEGVQLLLYNQALQLQCTDNTPPNFQIDASNCPSQPAGWYYVRIYTASGWNSTTPYVLAIVQP